MLTLIAIIVAFAATAPSQAASAAAPTPKPRLICREGAQELGSHIHTSRTCKTAEEWWQWDARRDERPATYKVVPGQGDNVPRPPRPPL